MNCQQMLSHLYREASDKSDFIKPKIFDRLARTTEPTTNPENIVMAIHDAIRSECTFIDFRSLHTLTDDEREITINLLAWIMTKMSDTKSGSKDNPLFVLLFIVVVLNCIDIQGILPLNQDYNDFVRKIGVLWSTCSLSYNLPQNSPVWEKELFDELQKAIKKDNFSTIYRHLISSNTVLAPSCIIAEFMAFFSKYDKKTLIDQLREIYDPLLAMQLLDALSLQQVAPLVARYGNHLTLFVFLFLLRRDRNQDISCDDLVTILTACTTDHSFFKTVVSAFADTPVLQIPFARVLANQDSEQLISDYLGNLTLHTYNHERNCLTDCFKEFEQLASPNATHYMWEKAYNVWQKWNFGKEGDDFILVNVTHSQIDYAVVKYYMTLPENECTILIDRCAMDLMTLYNVWHASENEMAKHRYWLLSKIQPCIHAFNILSGKTSEILPSQIYVFFSEIPKEQYWLDFPL